MARTRDFDRYVVACDYPGTIDPETVTASLAAYLAALGVTRQVRRLDVDWDLTTEAPLRRAVLSVLEDFARRTGRPIDAARDALAALDDALDARAARDALDARARAARDALDALDARAALDARDARDALDARDARDARAALDARAARAARAALYALDALAARDALDARDARDALDAALDARDARDALDARAALDARDARAARAARDALDALAARAALDARDATRRTGALRRFALWCLHRGSWWWYRWELSWIATTLIGSQQNGTEIPWARHLFEAYVAGAWFLFWTDDTLYWVAKPTVRVERVNDDVRRLHCEDGPAIESDVENLYFWHGVLVPAFVVTKPEWITTKHILDEENAEVRRVMLTRFGEDRFIRESGALPVSSDAFGDLYRVDLADDEPLVMVRVINSTDETDGSRKSYWLRVPPDVTTAHAAVAWTFGLRAEEYAPVIET